MKKMIQQKNTQVKELRERLSKYEKDDDDWNIFTQFKIYAKT